MNYTSGGTGVFDLNDPGSDSYLGWTTISRARVLSAAWNSERRLAVSFQVVNNQVVTQLVDNRFAYAESDNRSGSQVQYLFSPDYNLAGKTNVYLSFNSIYEQNQDSIGAVEYSVDGGTSWRPVVYYLAPGDIVSTNGAVDAVATFSAPQGDTATYTDPVTSEQAGGTYGAFIAAPITAELGAFIAPRGDDDAIDGKRVEIFRLPGADNQSRVRLRFAQAGTASWYFGVDNVGFYSITQVAPPAITVQPASTTVVAGQSGTLTSTVTGVGVGLQWYLGTAPVLNATNSSLGLSTVTAAQAGNYVLVASNAGGFFNGGAWRHVVVAFNPSGVASTYVDGNLLDTRDISPAGTGPDTTLALNIGQDGTGTYTDGGGVSSQGSIDEFAIWGRSLNAVEVATLFQANRAGTPLLTPAPTAARAAASVANGEVTISWTGGTPPFLLQAKGDLDDTWTSLITTSNRSVTVPLFGTELFFRVVSGTTNNIRLFKGVLSGANERPTPVTTSATGAAIAAFDGTQVFYYLEYAGLSGNATAAHIHGPAGINANAGVLLGFVAESPLGRSGSFSGSATAAPAVLDAAAAGNAYFNVHSTSFGGGEIRGQLVPVP